MDFQVRQLKDATESQIQEIADIFTDAFYGDISVKPFIGGDWNLLREMELAMLRASLLEGYVLIVTIGKGENEKIVSSGYWFGNGTTLYGSERQRALGYNAFFEKLSEETKTWLTKIYPKEMAKLNQSHFTKEEIAKRWWCYGIATQPMYQGKGYATAIIDTMFEKAMAERTFIGLGTGLEENVAKYLAMGFKLRGKGGCLPSPTGDFYVHFFTKGGLQ